LKGDETGTGRGLKGKILGAVLDVTFLGDIIIELN
jgi:hypothetical protein